MDLVLVGSWAWFASDSLPLLLIGIIGAGALVAEAVALRSLATRRVPLPAPSRMASFIRRSDEMRRGAIRNEDTGLYHRWYFELRLNDEAERCRRYGMSMAVIVLRAGIVNIAAFEGDQWRDQAAAAGRRTVQVVRNIDLSTGLGPLEFAICLVHCDHAGALRALSRLTEELSDYSCEAGIAVYPKDYCQPTALIELARGRAQKIDSMPNEAAS